MFKLLLVLPLLVACSSSETKPEAPKTEKQAAADTDRCLDNPELAKAWGECNVKNTIFLSQPTFAKCRAISPDAKGVVNFELRVKANGQVRTAKAVDPGQNAKFVKCLARGMKELQFAPPPKGKEATIHVPYQLD